MVTQKHICRGNSTLLSCWQTCSGAIDLDEGVRVLVNEHILARAAIEQRWYKQYLLKGDVLQALLLDDGHPGVLVVRHELRQGDTQTGPHLQAKPGRQHWP